ncbi:MAG: hypothetical protein HY962_01645 [Ignavibacteriae bacterium]|nr:hypothetical protein [Ignavibacteriota bacterium]
MTDLNPISRLGELVSENKAIDNYLQLVASKTRKVLEEFAAFAPHKVNIISTTESGHVLAEQITSYVKEIDACYFQIYKLLRHGKIRALHHNISHIFSQIAVTLISDGSTSNAQWYSNTDDELRCIAYTAEALNNRIKYKIGALRVVIPLLLAAMAYCTYILAHILIYDSDIANSKIDIISPASAHYQYNTNDVRLLDTNFTAWYYREFSRYYFGKNSTISTRLDPDKLDLAELIYSGQNAADGRSILLTSITITVTKIKDKPFEYNKLDTKARLVVSFREPNLVLVADSGVGPSLDVVSTISASGRVIITDTIPEILGNAHRIDLFEPDDTFDTLMTDGQQLLGCLRYINSERDYLNSAGTRGYELIRSIERLSQITQIAASDRLQINTKYRSLRGDIHNSITTLPAVKGLIYYRKMNSLLRCNYSREWQMNSAPPYCSAIEPFLPQMERTDQPKGVDIYRCTVTVDVLNTHLNEPAIVITKPSAILNPNGYVHTVIKISGCSSGFYQLSVKINGVEVSTSSFELLVPKYPQYWMAINDANIKYK